MTTRHRVLVAAALLGLVASLYGLHVETQAHAAPSFYRAWCDLGAHMSCSRVLTSPHSRLLQHWLGLPASHPLSVPNTYLGIVYYVAVLLYPLYPFTLIPLRRVLLFGAATATLAVSGYLLYVLYAVLHDACLVCIAVHVANVLVWLVAVRELRASAPSKQKRA